MGLYNKFPEVRAEYPGVRVLWLDTSPTCRIETVKKPINTLEDLKGLKIRVTGVTAVETAKALGYTPVTMPMGDVYLALERGVLDGTAIPVEVLVSRKWAEVLKHVVGNTDLGHDAFAVVINIDTWKKLPLDVQKVINELSGQWASDFTGKEWDKFEVEAEKITKAKYGVKYTYLSKEELARWNKLLKPVKDKYAESLEAKGLPGRKVLEEALRLSEKYGK